MKLTLREKFVLSKLLDDPEISNTEISKEMDVTTQAVGKIRRRLHKSGIIKGQELVIDYEKLGLGLVVIVLIKIMPKAFKKFSKAKLDKLLQPRNCIQSYGIPKTNVTHIMIYAFRNIDEYDSYFKALLTELGDYIEIKNTYVISPKSIIKSSNKDLFLKTIEEMDKPEKLHQPDILEEE